MCCYSEAFQGTPSRDNNNECVQEEHKIAETYHAIGFIVIWAISISVHDKSSTVQLRFHNTLTNIHDKQRRDVWTLRKGRAKLASYNVQHSLRRPKCTIAVIFANSRKTEYHAKPFNCSTQSDDHIARKEGYSH